MTFGPWMLPAFRVLAKFKFLRGTALDIFGYSEERRTERKLIADYEAMLGEIMGKLTPENHHIAVGLAAIPEKIRGFGHVKARHLTAAKADEAALLDSSAPADARAQGGGVAYASSRSVAAREPGEASRCSIIEVLAMPGSRSRGRERPSCVRYLYCFSTQAFSTAIASSPSLVSAGSMLRLSAACPTCSRTSSAGGGIVGRGMTPADCASDAP